MKRSALFVGSLCLLWGLLSVSCVQQEYALDDIDMTVNVGGDSLALPLGATDTIYAQTLLDDDAQSFLTELEDGALAILQDGGMDINVPRIEASGLTLSSYDGTSDYKLQFEMHQAEASGYKPKSVKMVAPVTDILPIRTGLNDISPDVKHIDYIALWDDAVLLFTFEVAELAQHPEVAMDLDIIVSLPDYVKPGASVQLEDGKLHIQGPLENGRLEHRMPLDGFNFSQFTIDDHYIDLTGEMDYTGNFILEVEDLNQIAEWNGKAIGLKTTFGVDNLTPKRYEGLFEPKLDPAQETMTFSDLPEMLIGDDMIFDFYAPYLLVSVPTNISVSLQNELTVTPIVRGTLQTDRAVKAQLPLPARSGAKMDTTRYYLANRPPVSLADGYEFIEFDLRSLLRRIPEALQIEMKTTTDQSMEMVYDFSVSYSGTLNYDFILPMAFGKDLHLTLSDTIDGLPDLVNEIISRNELQISGRALNTMPVNLELLLKALDADGREVPMETAPQLILAGTRKGDPVETPLDLTLGNRTGAVDKQPVKALVLQFTLTTGNDNENVPLKTTSWVRAALKARIPGGITVDLREMNENE